MSERLEELVRTVKSTGNRFLWKETTVGTIVEAAICKALAKQIDDHGGAAAVKELRQLIAAIGDRNLKSTHSTNSRRSVLLDKQAEPFSLEVSPIQVDPEHLSSASDKVIELAEVASLILDLWKKNCLRHALGERVDGE